MNENGEIGRGLEAQALLANPLLNEAFAAIEQRFLDRLLNSNLSASAVREEAYRMLCSVREVKNHLTRFVETGKLASVAKVQREDSTLRTKRLQEWDGSPDGQPRL